MNFNSLCVAASLCMSLALAGCNNNDDSSNGHQHDGKGAGGHVDNHSGKHSDQGGGHDAMAASNDAEFAGLMAEHHAGGIRLAEAELKRGEDADVKAIAQKIRDEQAREMPDLHRIHKEAGGGGAVKMPEPMKQKMSAAEQMVSRAQGHDADHHFLKHMTEHHQDGLAMMQKSLPNLKNQELRSMVEKMSKSQQQDVEKMKKLQH